MKLKHCRAYIPSKIVHDWKTKKVASIVISNEAWESVKKTWRGQWGNGGKGETAHRSCDANLIKRFSHN